MSDDAAQRAAWMDQYKRRERVSAIEQARRVVRRAERLFPGDAMNPMLRDARRKLDAMVKEVRATV